MSKASPITVVHKGSFKSTESWFGEMRHKSYLKKLNKLAQQGVEALSAATPVRTGKTAASWSYAIQDTEESVIISWHNSNETRDGDNIVLLLIRGHGTKGGHYYRANDFVTPAIQPIMDEIAEAAWKEVIK